MLFTCLLCQICNITSSMVPAAFFIYKVSNLGREDHVEFAALEHLENPDLHVDSVRVMKLYSRIKEVVASLDCPRNFTLKDLLTPEADRTEFFLGALLNFCLHR